MKRVSPSLVPYLAFLLTVPLGEVRLLAGRAWLTPTKAGFVLLAAYAAVAWLRGWRPPALPAPARAALAGFLLAAGAATAMSADPAGSLGSLLRYAGLAGLCAATAWVAAGEGRAPAVLGVLAALAALLSVLGIYQTLAGRTLGTLGHYESFGRMIAIAYDVPGRAVSVVRASATFDHPNVFGTFLLGAIPALLLAASGRGRSAAVRAACAAALALCVAALVFTFSRGAWLGALAAVAVVLAAAPGQRARAALLFCAAVLLAVAALPPGSRAALFRRSTGPESYDAGRRYSWHTAARIVAREPLLGVGPGLFNKVYAQYADPSEVYRQNPSHRMDAHNTFLDVCAESGLLTLLPFAAVLALAGAAVWKRVRRGGPGAAGPPAAADVAVLAGLAGILVQSLLQSLEYEEILWILLGLALGAARGPAEDAAPVSS